MSTEEFVNILFVWFLVFCSLIVLTMVLNFFRKNRKSKPKPSELVDKIEQLLQEHLGTTERVGLVICYDVKDEVGIATNISDQSSIEVMEDVIYNLKYKK